MVTSQTSVSAYLHPSYSIYILEYHCSKPATFFFSTFIFCGSYLLISAQHIYVVPRLRRLPHLWLVLLVIRLCHFEHIHTAARLYNLFGTSYYSIFARLYNLFGTPYYSIFLLPRNP